MDSLPLFTGESGDEEGSEVDQIPPADQVREPGTGDDKQMEQISAGVAAEWDYIHDAVKLSFLGMRMPVFAAKLCS